MKLLARLGFERLPPFDPWHPDCTRREVADAERRWAARNAEMEANPFCLCGAPAAVRIENPPQWPVVGRVQPFWWRCAEHRDVPLTAGWSGNPDGTFTPQEG